MEPFWWNLAAVIAAIASATAAIFSGISASRSARAAEDSRAVEESYKLAGSVRQVAELARADHGSPEERIDKSLRTILMREVHSPERFKRKLVERTHLEFYGLMNTTRADAAKFYGSFKRTHPECFYTPKGKPGIRRSRSIWTRWSKLES